jgi:L-lysine 2,3-aminomutase
LSRRRQRRAKILTVLGGTIEDWHNWRWHIRHIVRNLATLEKLVTLSPSQRLAMQAAGEHKLPFGMDRIDEAIAWIHDHPAIHEVLITGGDPLAMGNDALAAILAKVAEVPTVERIRIGSRTLVTIPMRITEGLVPLLGQYRVPGRREVAVMTHIQHPYEITPETAAAVNRLRLRCIPVYNQLVYTYYASRRFEATALRRQLRLIGVEPLLYLQHQRQGRDPGLPGAHCPAPRGTAGGIPSAAGSGPYRRGGLQRAPSGQELPPRPGLPQSADYPAQRQQDV